MLEALHLTKIYKTKGGADVRALDDVSIRFPEKGMVFLLGRSGSGKSTLLNVCGGLDAPTGGEVIVKGRSSKAFSQSDFDSYRNTYVGFIFQEYNILNEFTVEDNIALALELQGKPKDKRVIAKLLEDVDLVGYAKRKPNTLSGGQKQRIAIARALVKSPEIIMADEPTGALDSATGTQVFDTLKKLSKDKLVIVVSHDRDFAEQYGDRIIELSDGKVISDVTKSMEQQEALSENITVVGDTLCVKRGTELTEEDFAEIKNFLSHTDRDVIIATGEKDVKTFKEVSHINDSGEKEVFKDSDESMIERKIYAPNESRFIRSKLPARHAFKIGVSGLKTKPLRLFFTILLCTVSFIFFGLLSTMTFYDDEATFKQSLKDSNFKLVQMEKYYKMTQIWHMEGEAYEHDADFPTGFTMAELKEYAGIFGEDAFGGVTTWESFRVENETSDYWYTEVGAFAYLQEENGLRDDIIGRYPEKENEICISSYAAEMLYNCHIPNLDTGDIIPLPSPKDVIGKKVQLGGDIYTVVGIIDSGEIPSKYDGIKTGEIDNAQLLMSYYYELQDGLQLVVFVTQNQLEVISEENRYSYGMDDFSSHRVTAVVKATQKGNVVFPEWANAGYASFLKYGEADKCYSLIEGRTEPQSGEAYVSTSLFYEAIAEIYGADMDNPDAAAIYELAAQLYSGGVYEGDEEAYFREFTESEKVEKLKELVAAVQKDGKELILTFKLFDDNDAVTIGKEKTYTITGVWENQDTYDHQILLADTEAETLWQEQKQHLDYYYEYITDYKEPEDAIYGTLFLPYDHSEEKTNLMWDIYGGKDYTEDGRRYSITNSLISTLEMVNMVVETLSTVFLWIGIILAVFAALLLSNFISVSISYKKKEIGILRAVGARSLDVFKIFFSESFTISAICVVLAVIGSVVCCSIVNGILATLLGASLFVFGIWSFLVLIAIAFVTVVVATFLPVWHAAKKKPVESIRAL